MRPFYVFDRWGKQTGTIAHPLSAKHKEALNGEDSLTLECVETPLNKGDRIVWQDKFGIWHEHIVADTTEQHKGGKITQEAYCENSIAELLTDYLVEVEPRNAVASAALSRALEASGSRWEAGRVDPKGTASFSWYHTTAYKAVTEIVEAYAGELQTAVGVEGDMVVARRVEIVARRGSDLGRVFTYGRDLVGIERTVSSDPIYTALYGYGKGAQAYDSDTGEATGGYSRKITFGEVNGGVDWVGDEDAKLKYGVPDGKGGVKHAFGQVEFGDCEDKQELLELTRAELEVASKPKVTYKGSVLNFGAAGFANGEDCTLGDTIYLRDRELDVRLQGRVLEIERDLLNEKNTDLTLGNIRETFTQRFGSAYADLDWLKARADRWEGAAELPESYIDAVVARLNTLMNTTGGFTYIEAGNGIVTYDKPRDKNPTMAIQITGAGFRIANSKLADGTWDWRTFGTGDGFTADLINAGIIKGGSNTWNLETGDLSFEQGIIHSADDANFWNLTTGELRISPTAKVGEGNVTVSDYVRNVSSTTVNNVVKNYVPISNFDTYLNMKNVFNALTHDGADKGFFIQGDAVFFNGDFVRTGVIESTDGLSFWDLNTGYFETTSTIFHNMHSRIDNGMFAIKMDQTDIITMAAYTKEDNPNYHPAAIKAFTDLVLAAPTNIGVSYDATVYSTLTYEATVRNGTVNVVGDVSLKDGSLSVSRQTLRFGHGMLLSSSAAAISTFSVPDVKGMTLVESAEPAEQAASGLAIEIRQINDEEQLMRAADAGHMVWQADPETRELGIPIYTGDEWTLGVPEADETEGAEDVVVPTTELLTKEIDALHAEIDAIGDAVAAANPIAASAIKAKIASVRSREVTRSAE